MGSERASGIVSYWCKGPLASWTCGPSWKLEGPVSWGGHSDRVVDLSLTHVRGEFAAQVQA